MDSTSFTYQGKEHKIAKIAELESESEHRRLQIITEEKEQFTLTFKPSIFKWVIAKSE